MDDLLKSVAAGVAVIASLGAVALAVEQFTLRSRLRKTETWAVAMLAKDTTGERAAALTSIRLDATARIVAGILVPVRLFAEALVWAVAAPVVVAGVMADDDVSGRGAVLPLVVAVVVLVLTTRRGIRVYLERCRIASEYRREQPVVTAHRGVLGQVNGGAKLEYVFALGFALGACAAAAGIGLALRGDDVDGWPLFLIVAGVGVAYAALDLVRLYGRKRHPMLGDERATGGTHERNDTAVAPPTLPSVEKSEEEQ